MKRKWNLEAFAELGRMVRGEACELGAQVEPEAEEKPRKRLGRARDRQKRERGPAAMALVYGGKLYVPWPKDILRPGKAKREAQAKPCVPRAVSGKRAKARAKLAGQVGKKLPRLPRKYGWQAD